MRRLKKSSIELPSDWGRLPELLTEKEAAAILNVSVSYLRQSRSEGCTGNRTPAPKFTKIGKTVRYKKSELARWVRELPERSTV